MEIEMNFRSNPPKELNYRTLGVRLSTEGAPATLVAETRSFEVIGATEAPVEVYDWRRGEVVSEVLLMEGAEMPAARQVPLLDSHMRWGTASVLGSYRDMRAQGDQLLGRVFFSNTPEAESPYTKAREGHLTDFSVGYRVIDSQWVPKGEKAVIKGRSFEGPVSVVTRWRVKELSICPIGADEAAKARSEQHQPTKKELEAMDKRLRAYLEKRGLAQDATEEQVPAFLARIEAEDAARAAATPPPAAVDVDQLRREATGAERERIVSIDGLCQRAKCPEKAAEFIKNSTSVEEVRTVVMEHILAHAEGGHGYRAPAVIAADERDKFRAAAEGGILLRGGMRVATPAAGATDLRGYSLRELARHALRLAGQNDRGNAMEMVGRALTTSDLPLILANVANKSLFEGWESAEETWQVWCDTGSVSDFKINSAPRLSESDELDWLPEKMPYKYIERMEAQEQYSIATYGKMEAISRQAIINDDLDALTQVPRSHGEAAARKVADLPYAVLVANAAMGDGTALFHANHGNVAAVNGAPGMNTLNDAEKKMGLQKDLKGKRNLNIPVRFILMPVSIKGIAEVFFQSERYADSAAVTTDSSLAATRANIHAGDKFTRVYDARLDAASLTAWYAAAGRGRRRTVCVYFLDGVQAPYMEQKAGWSVDGVEYKVRIDAGAKAMDWKGLLYNPGV